MYGCVVVCMFQSLDLLFSVVCFFFQAEDGIRDLVRSRGLGDVYKRQPRAARTGRPPAGPTAGSSSRCPPRCTCRSARDRSCLLYTSDAADERSSVDLGGRRIIKKKKKSSLDTNATEYIPVRYTNYCTMQCYTSTKVYSVRRTS